MKTSNQTALKVSLASVLLGALATPLLAWEASARELDDAIQRGDFTVYQDHATAWLNGACVGEHEGGYLPFELDVTEAMRDGPNELVVRVVSRRFTAAA